MTPLIRPARGSALELLLPSLSRCPRLSLTLLIALGAWACSGSEASSGTPDAGPDALADAALDATADAGPDAKFAAGTDASDAGTDDVPPSLVGLSGPDSPTNAATVEFSFGCSEEGCTYSCRLA